MTTGKKIVHVISHTHWDREWYLPFEKHHVRLVALLDTLIELLERDSEFRSFHLDGQTIILEDYLQVRPEKKDQLTRLIQTGRLHIGPWYVLQDEFLTSSEANVRNLLTGLKDAKAYGSVSKIGYFPDSFGNMGQAPQLLRQAGMDCAVFGRGVKATGFNNSVEETGSKFESPFSEMIWESPDGSSVLGILFANWYHNGMEIPVDEDKARSYWETRIPKTERFASTPHLLFMNGCDHQPVQTNLSQALHMARKLFPDVCFTHSNFDDYVRNVKENIPETLTRVLGELRSQRTDGWTTLVNTASSRIYLKQANQRGQMLLEKAAEPLAAFASIYGYPYPHHLFTHAWKMLMQNHPHDSICGCSTDEVHREMMTRFAKSRQVAEEIIDDTLKQITADIDTTVFGSWMDKPIPFAIFNTTGWRRTGSVSMELDVDRIEFDGRKPTDLYDELQSRVLDKGCLMDAEGRELPFEFEDLGVHFRYELPDHAFRKRFMARRIRICFEADVQGLGYKTYAWSGLPKSFSENMVPSGSLQVGDRMMENDWIKVEFANNGSITLTDKATGHEFRDLGIFEDTGDIGNEYMFKQPEGEEPLTTEKLAAKVSLLEQSEVRAVFEVVHEWQIPAGADSTHAEDVCRMVSYRGDRTGQRVSDQVPLIIKTRYQMDRSGRGVKISVSFENQAKDHRLRVLLPTDLRTDHHSADSIFEVVKRSNQPEEDWKNPSYCHHQQAFVDVSAEKAGLTVANLGLNEYEVLRDGRNTIAITILRAVGELGDWGVFPTPEAQCLGEHSVEFEIIPHSGNGVESGAYSKAYQFQVPWTGTQTGIHEGSLPTVNHMLEWNGSALALSGVKISEESGDLIIRWFNMTGDQGTLDAIPNLKDVREIYLSNIIEERAAPLITDPEGQVQLSVRPAEIVTLSIGL